MRRYELLAPPGFDGEQELKRVMTWLGWGFAGMLLSFLIFYMAELGIVQSSIDNEMDFQPMAPFAQVILYPCLVLASVLVPLLRMLIRNIVYFRSGSKSFYTMRRLKNRWEYPACCALLPVCGIAAVALALWLTSIVCAGAYLVFTPDAWLYEGAGNDVLKLLSGGLL